MDALLESAVQIIRDGYKPEKIILFGSRARGDYRTDSDYDFIILKKTDERFVQRSQSIPDLPMRTDCFVYTPEEFATMKDSNPFIIEALKNSITLYEKND
ncbi:MAG: nucleotidyltransferase domain-containing protein [bacterium]|nr:nucleotidyltransferase domain-containing protein [bacterium]